MKTGDYFCIYNPSDCDESGVEVYVTPSETLNVGFICDCSEVHVTACEDIQSGEITCAITAEACNPKCPKCEGCDTCDPTHDPFSPLEQRLGRENGVNQLDCRLCQRREILAPIPTPTLNPVPSLSDSASASSSEVNTAVTMACLLCFLIRWFG